MLAAESALGGTTPEHIVAEANQSGSWFVRVSGAITSVAPSTLRAHTTFTHTYEPNDAFGQAAGIVPGTPITSTIYPDGDRDHYTFTASLDQRILIDLTDLPANYELALYRPDQTLAAENTLSGPSPEKIVFDADQAGDWLVRVSGAAVIPGGTYSPWPYSLEVALPELAYTHIQWAAFDEIARSEISGCDDGSCITYVLTDTYVTALALDSANDQVYWTG